METNDFVGVSIYLLRGNKMCLLNIAVCILHYIVKKKGDTVSALFYFSAFPQRSRKSEFHKIMMFPFSSQRWLKYKFLLSDIKFSRTPQACLSESHSPLFECGFFFFFNAAIIPLR